MSGLRRSGADGDCEGIDVEGEATSLAVKTLDSTLDEMETLEGSEQSRLVI